MARKIILTIIVLALISIVIWGSDYLGYINFSRESVLVERRQPVTDTDVISDDSSNNYVDYRVEVVTEGLFIPWSIVFTSEERILVTERNGSIREINGGILNPKPLITFPDVSATAEEGLMGLALDPDYSSNNKLYASYAYIAGNENMYVRVVSMLDEGDSISIDSTVIDQIPAARFHAGSRIKFGPDGKLYITTGDASERNLAQNMDSLAGKILRINADGSVPDDNPFSDSAIYSLGHRNPQGIDWHPEYGFSISTEHGPSVFDGPAGGDEINLIEAGENYGWPIVSHDRSRPGLVSPLIQYTPAVAPASGVFYYGDLIPQFRNVFFFGGLVGEGLYWAKFNSDGSLSDHGQIPEVEFGRIRGVAVSPSGELYFVTSNRDGRGNPHSADDRLFRIVPAN